MCEGGVDTSNPTEAVAISGKAYVIPVYEADGITVVDWYTMSPSEGTQSPPADGSSRIEGIRAILQLQDRCWVVALADGTTLEQGRTLEAGDRVVFRADRILELELGSAGAVDLEVNGERVRTGSLGDVVRLELRWKDDEVVTTFV